MIGEGNPKNGPANHVRHQRKMRSSRNVFRHMIAVTFSAFTVDVSSEKNLQYIYSTCRAVHAGSIL
jgi:hypothetical protein